MGDFYQSLIRVAALTCHRDSVFDQEINCLVDTVNYNFNAWLGAIQNKLEFSEMIRKRATMSLT